MSLSGRAGFARAAVCNDRSTRWKIAGSVVSILLYDGSVVTMDDARAEHEDGWVLIRDGLVEAVGAGSPPTADAAVDLDGSVVTPGLVNTHHHLYQTLTRARAQEADLFTWL